MTSNSKQFSFLVSLVGIVGVCLTAQVSQAQMIVPLGDVFDDTKLIRKVQKCKSVQESHELLSQVRDLLFDMKEEKIEHILGAPVKKSRLGNVGISRGP